MSASIHLRHAILTLISLNSVFYATKNITPFHFGPNLLLYAAQKMKYDIYDHVFAH